MPRLDATLQRLSRWDETCTQRLNGACRIDWLRLTFRAISRLGDGIFWYAMAGALLAVLGAAAIVPVLHMIAAGAAGTFTYKWLKAKTSRPRPYQHNLAIQPAGRPLDQFSFPSGHTLHAVVFTVVALVYFPWLAAIIVPFTLLVAISRLVLGLHYLSDVVAGAAIGAAIALASIALLA